MQPKNTGDNFEKQWRKTASFASVKRFYFQNKQTAMNSS
jgi:hypothetical protein